MMIFEQLKSKLLSDFIQSNFQAAETISLLTSFFSEPSKAHLQIRFIFSFIGESRLTSEQVLAYNNRLLRTIYAEPYLLDKFNSDSAKYGPILCGSFSEETIKQLKREASFAFVHTQEMRYLYFATLCDYYLDGEHGS